MSFIMWPSGFLLHLTKCLVFTVRIIISKLLTLFYELTRLTLLKLCIFVHRHRHTTCLISALFYLENIRFLGSTFKSDHCVRFVISYTMIENTDLYGMRMGNWLIKTQLHADLHNELYSDLHSELCFELHTQPDCIEAQGSILW